MRLITAGPAILAFVLSTPASGAQEDFAPARFQTGHPPRLPALTSSGGLVVVEAIIAPSGVIEEIVVVDDAPPFTEALTRAMRLWRFRPATADGEAVVSRVSVTALFRAPVLMGGGPPPPTRVAEPSGGAPYPTETSPPAFPPQALQEGVAMVEVEVDAAGRVENVSILSSAPGFDEVALEAARKFRFLPAKREGQPIESYAVVVFGMPQPVTEPLHRR